MDLTRWIAASRLMPEIRVLNKLMVQDKGYWHLPSGSPDMGTLFLLGYLSLFLFLEQFGN